VQASKINSQLTFEQRKEPKQELEKLEKEIADGNKRVESLRQVSFCAVDSHELPWGMLMESPEANIRLPTA
jgi:hypothetical protein